MKNHKTLKKGLSCAAVACVFLLAAACGEANVPSGNVEIWGAYNTTKIMREKYD